MLFVKGLIKQKERNSQPQINQLHRLHASFCVKMHMMPDIGSSFRIHRA